MTLNHTVFLRPTTIRVRVISGTGMAKDRKGNGLKWIEIEMLQGPKWGGGDRNVVCPCNQILLNKYLGMNSGSAVYLKGSTICYRYYETIKFLIYFCCRFLSIFPQRFLFKNNIKTGKKKKICCETFMNLFSCV